MPLRSNWPSLWLSLVMARSPSYTCGTTRYHVWVGGSVGQPQGGVGGPSLFCSHDHFHSPCSQAFSSTAQMEAGALCRGQAVVVCKVF